MFKKLYKNYDNLLAVYKDPEKNDIDKTEAILEMKNSIMEAERDSKESIESLQLQLAGMQKKYNEILESNHDLLSRAVMADPLAPKPEDLEKKKLEDEEAKAKAEADRIAAEESIFGDEYAAFTKDSYDKNTEGGE